VGIHDDYTRIALDLPAGSRYSLAVAGSRTLLVTFAEGVSAPPQAGARVGSEQVNAWQFGSLENQLALVIEAEHPLRASGQGFQVGFLPRGEGRAQDVLYIDLSAERQGPTVAQRSLDDLAPLSALNTTLSTTPDPTDTTTAAPTRAPAVRPRQTITRTVVIDPGHGGYDPGAQGYVSEEVVVLDIALRLRDALEAQGINVILSREGDYHLDDRKATDLAARAAMATTDRNLFVSIHANAAESSAANGIETWVFGEPLEEDLIQNAITENGGGSLGVELTEEAKQVHDSVLNDIFRQEQLHYSMTLAEAVQNAMIAATGARDRGIRKNYFYVIRNARIPAVLVEVGFVSNPDEGRNLGRADYRARIADGIAEGIVAFFEQEGALVSR
jgi:N-acetylmuramoyl-L-alanine amidase